MWHPSLHTKHQVVVVPGTILLQRVQAGMIALASPVAVGAVALQVATLAAVGLIAALRAAVVTAALQVAGIKRKIE